MKDIKTTILNNVCYTPLVYGRINKKLNIQISNTEIEKMIYNLIQETTEFNVNIKGKNFYIKNHEYGIKMTLNRNTFRVITVDKII